MRIFYLFKIKRNVLKDYKNNYEELYKTLDYIHTLNEKDINLGYRIFNSLIVPIKKDEFNNYIKENNIGNDNYICFNYTHTINDFFYDESTKMIIKNTFIKIKSNKSFPLFFDNIKSFHNLFVCDFNNHDYFLLDDACINK